MGPLELIVLLLFAAYIWAMVVCGMKGRWGWFVVGLFIGIFAYIGAFLDAKPGSNWARRHGDQKPCPDCAEWVAGEARVCKHCGYRFDGSQDLAGTGQGSPTSQ